MAKVNIPAEPAPNTTVYGDFRGVDFSKDPLLVDKSRSPYAINLISDKGGQPEKRVGWRVLQTLETPVNGLAYGYVDGTQVFIAHGGTKLYKWDANGVTVIKEGINNAKSNIFFMQHLGKSKLFILTGAGYLVYDGEGVKNVSEIATVPTILIGKKPGGGGTPLLGINMVQPKRTETFYGTETDKIYQLSANAIDALAVMVKKLNAAGGYDELTEGTGFTVDRALGTVIFTTAPGVSPDEAMPNVHITYAKTVTGYAEKVSKCTVSAHYGLGGSNRVFITRNPAYIAQDFWCEINDPTYFPDLNYAVIGTANTGIMGYSKIGEYLAIIKEDNQQDTTIFIRSAFLEGGKVSFPTKPGVTGIGAISPYSFASLIDEPLFLSRTGVYAITSNVVTAERTLQNRSAFVDSRLTKEPDLQNTVATEWNGYYVAAVNGNAYLLDSRQRSSSRENPNSYVYEAYFWNNINATCFMVHDGELYFGDSFGNICKFNTDILTMKRFSDNNEPITAVWASKMDNDGLPHMLKTMQKKGCLVTLKPITRSGVKLSVKTERDTVPVLIAEASAGILDWDEIDFNDFTFISNDNARTVVVRKKVKKYQALQFFALNDKVNQGFGLFNIVKSWVPINYVKR